MSDGKEVKRWKMPKPFSMWSHEEKMDHEFGRTPGEIEVMPVTEHESIIVSELRAEVERLKQHKAAYEADCKRIEYFDDLHEKVARQAKVIEIATRTMATVLEMEHCGETSCPRPMRAMCSNESHIVLRSSLKTIAAIERAEGGKE